MQYVGRSLLSFWMMIFVFAAGSMQVSGRSAHAQEAFSVNSSTDNEDASPGTNGCDTGNTLDGAAECTLRAAIQEANTDSDVDTVKFDGFDSSDLSGNGDIEIILQSENGQLGLSKKVVIDGTTAPDDNGLADAPTIVVSGFGLSSGTDAFAFQSGSGGSTLRDIGVVFAPNNGVRIEVSNVTISGCYIGVASNGTSAVGNANYGIAVKGSPIGTTIGPTSAGKNVISGNSNAGILLQGGGASTVRFNRIGTTADGTGEVPNGIGIRIRSNDNVIGNDPATAPNGRNLISGNDGNGIEIGTGASSSDANTIANNVIGLNSARDGALPNGDGLSTSGGIICGESSGTASGTVTVVQGNIISGNDAQGIWMTADCYNWHILDNIIGTNPNADGYASGLGNQFNGVNIKSNASTFSASVVVDENVIVNNGRDGVDIRGSRHVVTDNYIGVTPTEKTMGNAENGVRLDGTRTHPIDNAQITATLSDISIGDDVVDGVQTPQGDGNVIGGNGKNGVLLEGESVDVMFWQNYIGTNPKGAVFGNAEDGIKIVGRGLPSTAHEIGYSHGDTFSDPHPSNLGSGNIIAYNGGDGVSVGKDESTTDVHDVSVRANRIYQNGGTASQIGIDLGNSGKTANDDADSDDDDGPNNLQNYPSFQSVKYNSSTNEVAIEYLVPTSSSFGTYPFDVDFYVADSEASGEGKRYLATQEFRSTDVTRTLVLDLDNYSGVTQNDAVVATATDANGNTSEFVAPASPLPVEIASFEAIQSGEEAVELTWTTASETNSAGFRVQHRRLGMGERESGGDGAWKSIGFVESRADGGTTTNPRSYRFSTKDLAMGSHQFRLKQVDLSGATHLHKAVTVELTMQEPIMLSAPAPNPVQSQASISFAVREAKTTSITVYNVLGQKVRTLYRGTPTAGKVHTVDLRPTDLSSGVYFVRLRTGGQRRTQRLTVAR